MKLSERIEQLEGRLIWLHTYLNLMDESDFTKSVYLEIRTNTLIDVIKGQIQALKWVESEKQKRLERIVLNVKDYFNEAIKPIDNFNEYMMTTHNLDLSSVPPGDKNKQQNNKP